MLKWLRKAVEKEFQLDLLGELPLRESKFMPISAAAFA